MVDFPNYTTSGKGLPSVRVELLTARGDRIRLVYRISLLGGFAREVWGPFLLVQGLVRGGSKARTVSASSLLRHCLTLQHRWLRVTSDSVIASAGRQEC